MLNSKETEQIRKDVGVYYGALLDRIENGELSHDQILEKTKIDSMWDTMRKHNPTMESIGVYPTINVASDLILDSIYKIQKHL